VVLYMKWICIVEDEPDLNRLMQFYLEKECYSVISCSTFAEARQQLNSDISVWVVDIMLPDGSGLDILKLLKAQNSNVSVIIISAKGDRFDRVSGFELGCDDYIAKPFLPAELIFRIKKLLQQKQSTEKQNNNIVSLGCYEIYLSRRIVLNSGEKVDITSREFDIILFFLRHKGQAVSREQLLQDVWSDEYFGSDRIVDNYIKNIRRKLPKLQIETIYGYGYRYN
jgi:two-component system response regulator CssR